MDIKSHVHRLIEDMGYLHDASSLEDMAFAVNSLIQAVKELAIIISQEDE